MPAGSLSNVLGVSTAAPKAEIVPKWEWLWLREIRQVGIGLKWGKVETGASERGLLSGFPSVPARECACAW